MAATKACQKTEIIAWRALGIQSLKSDGPGAGCEQQNVISPLH
jgi:hypothetical protein